MKHATQFISTLALGCGALLLAACGGAADPHEAPREPKAYEQVNVAQLAQPELLAHLATLANAASTAAAAGEAVEFHHLEIALTPTLEAIEATAAGKASALATIQELKDLAIKLHTAGHDGNVGVGAKIAARIAELSERLANELA